LAHQEGPENGPMSAKQVEVQCPCCSTLLVVDVRTEKVLRHSDPRQLDETGKPVLDEGRWDTANERVDKREQGGLDHFDAALGKERSREDDLGALFDKAKQKAARRPKDDDLPGSENRSQT
jgi:hypothetical protein